MANSNSTLMRRLGLSSLTAGLVGGVWGPVAAAQEPTDPGGDVVSVDDDTTKRTVTDDEALAASSGCPTGSICVWEHDNYQGNVYRFSPPNQDANYTNGSPDWKGTGLSINDQISSYKNATGVWVQFYQNDAVNGWGAVDFCAGPGSRSSNLSSFNAPGRWNPEDSFSAHQTRGGSQPSDCYYAN